MHLSGNRSDCISTVPSFVVGTVRVGQSLIHRGGHSPLHLNESEVVW